MGEVEPSQDSFTIRLYIPCSHSPICRVYFTAMTTLSILPVNRVSSGPYPIFSVTATGVWLSRPTSAVSSAEKILGCVFSTLPLATEFTININSNFASLYQGHLHHRQSQILHLHRPLSSLESLEITYCSRPRKLYMKAGFPSFRYTDQPPNRPPCARITPLAPAFGMVISASTEKDLFLMLMNVFSIIPSIPGI